MQLRPYQSAALGKSLERLNAGVNRQLFSMATGLGKGALFAALRSHHGFTGKVMVLVHTDELAEQAAKKLHQWNPGMMIGTEMGQRRATPMDNFIVGSVPTLGRRGSYRINQFEPQDFGAIISDEVHHLPGDSRWQRVLEHFGLDSPGKNLLSLGMTATPNRSDGKGLRPWTDEVVYDMGILEGITQGYLADLKCFRISTKSQLDGVHTVRGKFNDAELSKEINTAERNGLIVQGWAQHAWQQRTLIFTQNIQHALDLAAAFEAYGVGAKAVWGEDPERDAKVQGHRAGQFPVLLNAQMLREGYDDPEIVCVVLAAPHLSALPVSQEVGRVTRIPDDVSRLYGNLHAARAAGYPISKEFGIVLDITDNTSKHSLVSIPSLLGMPKDLDLKGTPVTKAKEQLDRMAAEYPTANLADLKDLSKLESIAHQVSLFQVKFPVEIKTLTELAWRQQGDGYYLPVKHDRLTLAKDLREEWWVRGKIEGKDVEIHAQNLSGAFNAADREVLSTTDNKYLYVRDAKWRDNGPSDKQVQLCAKLRIPIPLGATRGMVSAALDSHFQR
jgi:superfamily II DNA or RNA helicase